MSFTYIPKADTEWDYEKKTSAQIMRTIMIGYDAPNIGCARLTNKIYIKIFIKAGKHLWKQKFFIFPKQLPASG